MALTDETDGEKRKILRDWMGRYIDSFSRLTRKSIERLTAEDLEEYVIIGQLPVRCSSDKELLRMWFKSLCNPVLKGKGEDEEIIAALECALLLVDINIFKGHANLLLKLSRCLLSNLDSEETSFVKTTFVEHRAILSAIHQIFVVLQQISPRLLNPKSKRGVYQVFSARLKEIKRDQTYYPYAYHAMLIQQSIQRLENKEKMSPLMDTLNRLRYGLHGALCMAEGVRGFASLEYKHDSFAAGYTSFQEAFRKTLIEREKWYDWIQALNQMGFQVLLDPQEYDVFEQCYDSLSQKLFSIKKKKDRIAIQFGMINQAIMLIQRTQSTDIRANAVDKLLELAKISNFSTLDDVEIFEAFLEAFTEIFAVVEQKSEVKNILEVMGSFQRPSLVLAFTEWLGDTSLCDKLGSLSGRQNDVQQSDRMFHAVEREIAGEIPLGDPNEYREELKALYKAPDFAQSLSVFDYEEAKHVQSFKYHLVHHEQVIKSSNEALNEHHSRPGETTDQVEVKLDEIFAKRRTEATAPTADIHKVLLVGNPGTGKTSLSRKLAYQWATGEWGKEFKSLYVVPVRELDRRSYNGSNMRRAPTLATAIANLRFRWRNDKEFIALHEHISSELEKTTTLVILDGLDEAAIACHRIVDEAKNCACKLLILSRPCNLHRERALVDFEADVLGMSDDQLVEFVKGDIPQETFEFLTFLRDNSTIWDVAHLPVAINILCVLWRDNKRQLQRHINGSLRMMYLRMSQYVWKRCVKKDDTQDINREEVFNVLGNIAFDALEAGQTLIDQEIVEGYVETLKLDVNLRTCGLLLLQLEGNRYEFPHMTFQEYFAGRYLARALCKKSTEKEVRRTENFLYQHKYDVKYRVVLQFMAEEVRGIEGVSGYGKIMSILDREPRDIVGVQHVLLHCMVLKAIISEPVEKSDLDELRKATGNKVYSICYGLVEMLAIKDCAVHCSVIEHVSTMVTLLPKLADLFLTHLLKLATKNDGYGNRAFQQIMTVIRSMPKHREMLVSEVLQMLRNSDPKIRKLAVNHTPRLISAAADKADQLMNGFLETSRDRNSDVRESAIKQIPELVSTMPKLEDKLVPECFNAFADVDGSVRMCAFGQVPTLIKLMPGHAGQIIDRLLDYLREENEDLPDLAFRAILTLIKTDSEHASRLKEVVLQLLTGCDGDIHLPSIKRVPELIKAMPEHVSDLVQLFFNGLQHKEANIRAVAVSQISKFTEMLPEYAVDMVDVVFGALRDGEWKIRASAVKQIPKLLEQIPGCADKLTCKFFDMLSDNKGEVRTAAVSDACGLIVRKREHSEALLERILRLSNDEAVLVRSTVVYQIPALLKALPEHAEILVDKLFQMITDEFLRYTTASRVPDVIRSLPETAVSLRDKLLKIYTDQSGVFFQSVNRSVGSHWCGIEHYPALISLTSGPVRSQLMDRLLQIHSEQDPTGYSKRISADEFDSIPVEVCLHQYWQRHDLRLIPRITTGFLCFPTFIDQTSEDPKTVRLAIQDSSSNVHEWEKPFDEAMDLLSAISNEIKRRYPRMKKFLGCDLWFEVPWWQKTSIQRSVQTRRTSLSTDPLAFFSEAFSVVLVVLLHIFVTIVGVYSGSSIVAWLFNQPTPLLQFGSNSSVQCCFIVLMVVINVVKWYRNCKV